GESDRAGAKGGGGGGELWFSGAVETARRGQGCFDVVGCTGRGRARGVEPASPGSIRGGMSTAPTGRNHSQHECGSGRSTLGSATNGARPGSNSAISASPCELMTPRLRVSLERSVSV